MAAKTTPTKGKTGGRTRRRRRQSFDPLWSEQQRQMVLQALRVGAAAKHAAKAAGIGESTFKSWLSRAREERARREIGEDPNPTFDRHLAILADVEKADAEGAVTNVAAIQRAANGGRWQAAAWLLSRRHPEEYGPPEQRVRMETVHDDDSPADQIGQQLDEMRDRLSEQLQSLSAKPDTDV